MSQKCMVPNCHQTARKSWALVPLCPFHHEELVKETNNYYKRDSTTNMADRSRKVYHAIKQFTPWGMEVKK
jgi:hypothetical protein